MMKLDITLFKHLFKNNNNRLHLQKENIYRIMVRDSFGTFLKIFALKSKKKPCEEN